MPSTSLSFSCLMSKFAGNAETERRKGWSECRSHVAQAGWGRQPFRSNERRTPGDGDDDYDGVGFHRRQGGRTRPRLRWNRFKWMLFADNFLVSSPSTSSLKSSLFCNAFPAFAIVVHDHSLVHDAQRRDANTARNRIVSPKPFTVTLFHANIR